MKIPLAAVAAAASLGLALSANAQGARGAAVTSIDGKKIAVDYGRPALKGRSLEELMKQLPADRIWRAGENQVTTLSTEGDISVGGQRVPAGKYSVYVHAGEDGQWSLVLNRDLGIALGKIWAQAPDNMKKEPWPRLDGYDKNVRDQELARVKMEKAPSAEAADLFTISFAPKGENASMTLAWGNEAWSVDVAPAK
jgi:hypothetical protein